MSYCSITLLSLQLNPRESQNENTCLFVLIMTMHYAKLPKRAMQDVMMDRSQMKRPAVRHQHADVGQADQN
jgi:hypothetical protein